MKLKKALAVVLALMLVFTLTACQEQKAEVKELAEEYEVIVEVGFVPFIPENAEVLKYETIGNTTSRITVEFEGIEYLLYQTTDSESDFTENMVEELTPTEVVYINESPALLGYEEGVKACAFWGDDMYMYSVLCKENFNLESFNRFIGGSKDETVIEDLGLTASFSAEGFDAPSAYVNIIAIEEGEALINSCPCYFMTNPGEDTILKLSAAAGESADASVDGLVFTGELDEENSAFILGEQHSEIVGKAAVEGDSYVYEIANPFPDASERVAFAIGADIIAGSSFYTGEMVVVVLEP